MEKKMKKPMTVFSTWVLGSFAALVVSGAAFGDFIFFSDPGAFFGALEANNKVSKGFWDMNPNNVGPNFIGGFADPLNINNIPTLADGTPFWDAETMLDNVTFQSNLDPQGGQGPNPRGANGLAFATPPFFGIKNNVLVANTFVDSFDILSGPPAGDNHTAMALNVVALASGGAPIIITVWDKNGEHQTKFEVGPLGDADNAVVGILALDGRTIGRVNIYDPSGGAEGMSAIEVFIPAPGSLALLGLSGLFVRRRRRR
jgi:hypothetical protein